MWSRRTGFQGGGKSHTRPTRGASPAKNPWLGGASAGDELDRDATQAEVPPRAALPLEPQPGACAHNGVARLPRVTVAGDTAARVWWVGVHGGAGESTLAQLLAGSRASGHAWPVAARGDAPRPAVVLVARTHASGLRAAQAAATEWASGEVPVRLLGLVLIADAPGRLPRPLRDLGRLVAGGVPAAWQLPWHESWRLGDPLEPSSAPSAARELLERIAELAPASRADDQLAVARPDQPQPAQPSPQGAARA